MYGGLMHFNAEQAVNLLEKFGQTRLAEELRDATRERAAAAEAVEAAEQRHTDACRRVRDAAQAADQVLQALTKPQENGTVQVTAMVAGDATKTEARG